MIAHGGARSLMVEQLAHNQLVPGSNPGGPTIYMEVFNVYKNALGL